MTDLERMQCKLAAAGIPQRRTIWQAQPGEWRVGHGGDLVTMLDDLGIPNVLFFIPRFG
jgi:hypothetical protein